VLSALLLNSPRWNSAGFHTCNLSQVIHVTPLSALVTKHCSLFVPAPLASLVCALKYNVVLSYIYSYEKFEIPDMIYILEMH